MGRALAKIIWPVVFVYFLTRYSYQWPDVYRWWFVTLAPYPLLWCAITGGNEFLLLCLPPPRMSLPPGDHMPYRVSDSISTSMEPRPVTRERAYE